jgi:hypothetical protein
MEISRTDILAAIRSTIEPLDCVSAMWEGGAAAFDRVDEWSDIDLQIEVEDGRAGDVMAIVEQALRSIAPIAQKYVLPMPTWHGHAQAFYALEGASPYLMIDLVVIEKSATDKFLQREIHGTPLAHFDRSGVTAAPAFDRRQHGEKIESRIAALRATFDLFQTLTLKELNRGNLIEAVSYYQGMTLRPLVEALRILHAPHHYNFHTRYVYYELPKQVVEQLETLFLPRDAEDLRRCHGRAGEMFHQALEKIDGERKEW